MVLVDQTPIVVDTRKAIALVAYLAATDLRPTRDELVNLLWPDLEPERGRATLRRTLSAVRSGLGGRWLVADRTRIGLSRVDLYTDDEHVEKLLATSHGHESDRVCPLCIPALTEAASLHRGDFMAGFFLRDSPEFDDWQRSQEERHRRRLREVLDRLGLALASAGRFEEAAEAAHRRVTIDPLDESGHRELIQFLVWSGDRAGALRQYRDCAERLDRELGVAPLPPTRHLYESILAGREPPAPAGRAVVQAVSTPAPTLGLPDPVGFVGRTRELAALVNSTHRVVLLVGEEGIGKSRLIDQWLESAGGQPVARCAPPPGSDGPPYLVIRDALAGAPARQSTPPPLATPPLLASEAVRLVPDLIEAGFSRPDMTDNGPGAMTRFHSGLTAALNYLLNGGWLVIDDAQWIDESSAALLAFLLTHPPVSVRLLLAWREEDISPSHPLVQLVRRLERMGMAMRISLGPLADSEALELLEQRSPLHPERAHEIVRRAGGNPLFLVAYQDSTGSSRADLPDDLDHLVEARIDRLSPSASQLLAASAIIGRESDLETVRGVSGRSEEELVPALEELVHRRLLVETPIGVDVSYDVVRRAVDNRLSATRRRLLHGRAADLLKHRFPPGVFARHLEEAGRLEEAAAAHAAAGEEALGVFAYPEAKRHLLAALRLGHPDRSTLNLWLGDSAVRLGDYGAAMSAYEAVGDDQHSVEVEYRLGGLYGRLGRWELAEATFRAASALATDEGMRGRIAAERAVVAHRQGDDERARELATTAADHAGRAEDLATLAQAANLGGMLAADPEEAVEHLEKANALAEETGRADIAAAALNNLGLAHRRAGSLQAAITAARAALAILRPVGDRHQLAALHNNLADALHEAGEENEARHHLTESARLFSEVGIEAGTWEPEVWMLSEW